METENSDTISPDEACNRNFNYILFNIFASGKLNSSDLYSFLMSIVLLGEEPNIMLLPYNKSYKLTDNISYEDVLEITHVSEPVSKDDICELMKSFSVFLLKPGYLNKMLKFLYKRGFCQNPILTNKLLETSKHLEFIKTVKIPKNFLFDEELVSTYDELGEMLSPTIEILNLMDDPVYLYGEKEIKTDGETYYTVLKTFCDSEQECDIYHDSNVIIIAAKNPIHDYSVFHPDIAVDYTINFNLKFNKYIKSERYITICYKLLKQLGLDTNILKHIFKDMPQKLIRHLEDEI